jgi:serine/threonine protein kinase
VLDLSSNDFTGTIPAALNNLHFLSQFNVSDNDLEGIITMRLKIAQGVGQGLSHIHNVCKPHIIHRDIKSSNILLDKDFKAYLADFGLARLILPDKTHVTTELVGTLGYIPLSIVKVRWPPLEVTCTVLG